MGVALPGTSRSAVDDTLDELALLADTAGAEVIDRAIQERPRFDPAHFVGRGKVDEIKERVEELKIDVVIFDDDLSPAQTRNLEMLIDRKIIDRSRLILDIFSSRAQTREAQTQVELAQLTYMLPRLTRQWTHLSRQAGGGGASGGIGTRGPGETQLEVDRRATRSRITALERALDKIVKQRDVGRQGRSGLFSAALVGYTNAGKSTLLRALSGADVFIEDRLFATLDSTTRRVHLGYNRDILLTDTVGFIRKLPHHLIASFRSTLEEAVSADLLLHVVDGGYAHCDEQIETVFEVLTELGIQDRPTLMVFNKLDKMGIAPRFMRSISTEVAEIIRRPADEHGARPSVLSITQGNGDKFLYANELTTLSDIKEGAFLIDLGQIELDVLLMFRKRAVMAPPGSAPRELLGVLGQGQSKMLESLFDRLVQSSREETDKLE